MLFTLEAVQAAHGDCLLLHYGDPVDPRLIVIDGGPGGSYPDFLKPRLQSLRLAHQDRLRVGGMPDAEARDAALPVRMVMISHIDDDHINGIQDLLKELRRPGPRALEIETLWHNSFDDLIGNEAGELDSASVAAVASAVGSLAAGRGQSAAIIASVRQGRTVRNDASALGLRPNDGFENLVTARAGADNRVDQGNGLTFTVVGPNRDRVAALQTEWNTKLRQLGIARTAEFVDESVFNLSSIVVLASAGGKTMLLTGDARGDHILSGLEVNGLLAGGKLHVDLLKIPHHGSDHNVSTEFFRQVTADHYVVSGDGKHGNPEIGTLKMLSEARGNARFTLYLTNRERRLERFFDREHDEGKRYRVVFREANAPSVRADLGDPLPE
jgi:hypothetical protein